MVDSVDGVVEMLVRIGATAVTPPHDAHSRRAAVVNGPDGHTIEPLQAP